MNAPANASPTGVHEQAPYAAAERTAGQRVARRAGCAPRDPACSQWERQRSELSGIAPVPVVAGPLISLSYGTSQAR